MFLQIQRFSLYGQTYFVVLFSSVNVGCGPAEERVLLTGLHAVSDIYCECCKTTLGWKYVSIINNLYRLLNGKKTLVKETTLARLRMTTTTAFWRLFKIYLWLFAWTTTTLKFWYCFHRSMHLKIAKNTKKESLLSKWFIWSKTTDGNDHYHVFMLNYRRWSSRWKILYSLFVYITICEL